MNTQEQIQQTIDELIAREVELTAEAARVSDLINFWTGQLRTVHPTYTDTPMAEEYYGGW